MLPQLSFKNAAWYFIPENFFYFPIVLTLLPAFYSLHLVFVAALSVLFLLQVLIYQSD